MKQINVERAFKILVRTAVTLFIATVIIYIEWLTYTPGYNDNLIDRPPSLVFADGTRFICNQTYYRGENPTDDEILGTIDSLIDSTEVPTKNGQTNFSECFGQPYTVRDGKLIIRRGKQLERPVKNDDGSWRTEYYYIWYVCEPG